MAMKTAFPVWNGYAPKEGPKAMPVTLDFSSVSIHSFDLLLENSQGVLQFVQSIYVDNSANTNSLSIVFGQTGQHLLIPARAQGNWPVISPDQTQLVITTPAASDLEVLIILLNVPMAYTQWGPTELGGLTEIASASFTRPANTTAYAIGDLVANSTTAGSIVPMPFAVARATNAGGLIRRARLSKTGTSITNALFRLHLWSASPTPANGDNGAFSTNHAATYMGAFDLTVGQAFTDGAAGQGVPTVGAEINFDLSSGETTIYGLLEARGAYTPISAEVFTLALEVLQN